MNGNSKLSSLLEHSPNQSSIQAEAVPDAPEHGSSQEDSHQMRDHDLSSLLRMHVSPEGRRHLPAVATSTPIGHVDNEDQEYVMISPIQPATLSVSAIRTESPAAASLDNNNTGQSPPPAPSSSCSTMSEYTSSS